MGRAHAALGAVAQRMRAGLGVGAAAVMGGLGLAADHGLPAGQADDEFVPRRSLGYPRLPTGNDGDFAWLAGELPRLIPGNPERLELLLSAPAGRSAARIGAAGSS